MIIAGGLDGVPGIDILGGLMPACAPEVSIMIRMVIIVVVMMTMLLN